MPAAAASALRPMATRMPLIAMTAVQALCKMAKRIPDQPNNLSRGRSESVDSLGTSVWAGFASPAICLGTEIECSEVQELRQICARIHGGLRFFGGFGGWRLGGWDAPGKADRIYVVNADLIGFGGSNLADPGYAKTGFAVPAALHFYYLPGRCEISHAIEACAVFADVRGIGTLRKGIAIAIIAANENAKGLRGTLATTCFTPERGSWFLKGEADFTAALPMRFIEDHANFLLFLGEFADDKELVAEIYGSVEPDQSAAGIEHERGGGLMERANDFAPAVDDDRDMERFAFARATGLFCLRRGK